MGRYALHVEKWRGCTDCDLHLARKHMVFGKGKLPCDVLFIGEAPGASEDITGIPFDGPAGDELDRLIKRAELDKYRLAYTNLVCCLPLPEEGKKIGMPDDRDIQACSTRLAEFIVMAKPRVIVCAGDLSQKWIRRDRVQLDLGDTPLVDVTHPAGILRAKDHIQGFMRQKFVIALRDLIEEHLDA